MTSRKKSTARSSRRGSSKQGGTVKSEHRQVLSLEALENRRNMAVMLADLNGDSFDDMVVGSPYDGHGKSGIGTVSVVYANRTGAGLNIAGDQIWTQDSTDVRDDAEFGDRFGEAVAAGDFNRDGFRDLAIGAPGEDLEAWGQRSSGPYVMGSIVDAGAVHILYGSATGVTAARNQTWTQDSLNIADEAERYDEFGAVLTSGDFNGDGYADLAIGVPNENVGDLNDAGAVHVLYGSSSGLTSSNSQLWTQNSLSALLGVASQRYDFFGSALAAGDISGDGISELAIGAPGQDIGPNTDAGEVVVLYGSSTSRLIANSGQTINQGTIGTIDTNGGTEGFDQFGHALVIADFNGDGLGDLAASAPGEDDEVWDLSTGTPRIAQKIVDAGGVEIIYARRSTTTGPGRLSATGKPALGSGRIKHSRQSTGRRQLRLVTRRGQAQQ